MMVVVGRVFLSGFKNPSSGLQVCEQYRKEDAGAGKIAALLWNGSPDLPAHRTGYPCTLLAGLNLYFHRSEGSDHLL